MNLEDKITPFFTYSEVIKSNIADRLQIDNSLPEILLPKITLVAENILEKVRAHFKSPVIITSWYRCPAVNQMISNNPNSQHTKGEAVDFIVKGINIMDVAKYIRDNLDYDQLVIERSWVHCSYKDKDNRKDVLRTPDGSYYQKGLGD